MVKPKKTLQRVLSRTADANIRFGDLCKLLEYLGFERRVRGSHHIFRKQGVLDKINLQQDGSNAKPYRLFRILDGKYHKLVIFCQK